MQDGGKNMERKITFSLTGGALLVQFIVGGILTGITSNSQKWSWKTSR
jgi:hypothetical protein